jgi:hypothetical protein
MGQLQCPVCYSPLDFRDVTPCFVCGSWPEVVARFDATIAFTEFRLPWGRSIVLCRGCELEEFMVPGGWGYRLAPKEKLPVNVLQRVRAIDEPRLGRDKFCPACNIRLAFAQVIADHQGQAEPGAAAAGDRDNG